MPGLIENLPSPFPPEVAPLRWNLLPELSKAKPLWQKIGFGFGTGLLEQRIEIDLTGRHNSKGSEISLLLTKFQKVCIYTHYG